MSERSEQISKLKNSPEYRTAYIRAKLNVNIPSQIRGLRRRRSDMTQKALGEKAGMKQSRISAMERPGATKFNLETLVRLAVAFEVGLIVKFASYSEMLKWENQFSQDRFDVTKLDEDTAFLTPAALDANEKTDLYWNIASAFQISDFPVGPLSVASRDQIEPLSSCFKEPVQSKYIYERIPHGSKEIYVSTASSTGNANATNQTADPNQPQNYMVAPSEY